MLVQITFVSPVNEGKGAAGYEDDEPCPQNLMMSDDGDDVDNDDDDGDDDDRSDGDHDEDDEKRPQHQEDFLVHNVQRKQAHGVRFLEKQISFLQIGVLCLLLTSTCPAELWVKKSHLVILGKTSCIGSTWHCT